MTIDLYPEIIRQEDLSPDSGFGGDIDEDCQVIHDATKGWGANAQKVIDSLATKDASDRYMLSKRYEELFENKLVDIMKKEFRGDFGLAMEFLAMPLHEAECYMIKKATEGIGASIKILYCTLFFLLLLLLLLLLLCLLFSSSIYPSIHTCIHPHKHTYICISMVAHAFCFLSIVIRKTTTNI